MRSIWIPTHAIAGHDHLVDGERLARDTQRVLDDLASSGYEVASITPVVSGRWDVRAFDSRTTADFFPKPTIAPDSCASYGYSMTDGILLVAKKK